MAKQRYKEAEVVVRKAAKLNRVTLPPEVMNLSSSYSSEGLIKSDQKKFETNAQKSQNGVSKTLMSEAGSNNTQTLKSSRSQKHSESELNGEALTNAIRNGQGRPDRNNSGAPVLTKYQTMRDSDAAESSPGSALTPDVRFPRSYTVIDLFRTPRIRLYSLITFYLW